MSDEDSIAEIFDKINSRLNDVDLEATTRVIKSTTKAPVNENQGKFNACLKTYLGRNKKLKVVKIKIGIIFSYF